ncbi:hypothetical protein WJX75_004040 [Coccomyxa subellipsoidea]|uniref:Uncharacterized protein n=1 Tax=Coccomyxa subellipsoidea TaxID=248742 RepID=A0ABR2YRM0_9CHLO
MRATIWQQAEIAADSASIAAELNHRLHIIAAYATSVCYEWITTVHGRTTVSDFSTIATSFFLPSTSL